MIKIYVQETDFFLPEDGQEAEQAFLDLIQSPDEVWISAYGFTLQPMFDELAKLEDQGIPLHLLLDHSQEAGRAEAPKVKALFQALQHGDLTITTAGINSGAPRQIWHWKGGVFKQGDNWNCWEGSTNFSASGWLQGNSARIFQSEEWAQAFIAQFEVHRQWARENEPQYQLNGV